MRFCVIFITLFSIFLISPLEKNTVHAAKLHGLIGLQGNFVPREEAFKEVHTAYKNFNFEKAAEKTIELKFHTTDEEIAEKAHYLLGEIYLSMAEKGHEKKYRDSIDAFRDAYARFPKSAYAVHALLKIGRLYVREGMFYEGMAAYNTIIKKHGKSHSRIDTRLRRAEAFVAWGKYEKAITEFDLIDPTRLSQSEKTYLLLGYAETYYILGDKDHAFDYYKIIPPQNEVLQSSPKTLFQYGSSAYHAGAYLKSREVLFILHNKYPKWRDGLLAFARIGDTLRLQNKKARAYKIYKQVDAGGGTHPRFITAHLVAAMGQLDLANCTSNSPTSKSLQCSKEKAHKTEAGLNAISKIMNLSQRLFDKEKRSFSELELLFEASLMLEKHGIHDKALQLNSSLKENKLPPVLKAAVKKFDQRLPALALNQLVDARRYPEALGVFYTHEKSFTKQDRLGRTGLNIGISFAEAGLFDQAIQHLKPIASSKNGNDATARASALFLLAQVHFYNQNDTEAESNIQQFKARYTQDKRRQGLELILARISHRKGDNAKGLKILKHWIQQHSASPLIKEALFLQGKIYEKQNALSLAASSYRRIKERPGPEKNKLDLRIADLYYRAKRYQEAIPFYKKASYDNNNATQQDWATFQLAQSYKKLGQPDKGQVLFSSLEEKAEDTLIKAFSAQKNDKKNETASVN